MSQTLTAQLADLPACTLLAIDGHGAPEGPGFGTAVGALHNDRPIEGTWWSGDDRLSFDLQNPAGWHWTLAVPVPSAARLIQRPAQRVAWIVHHGPYEDEGPTLAALYAFVAERGLTPAGPHSEVYATDPSRVAPANMRTELRVPVR